MKKHLKLCVALIVVAAIVMSLMSFLLYWFFGDKYEDFEDFNKEFSIPGLDEGFIPQGLGSYTDGSESSANSTVFFVSGYMNKGGASRLYVVKSGETVGYITILLDDDGTIYEGHGSGVASNGTKVWVCSESTVYALSYDDVLTAAEENGSVTITGSFDAYNDASFCYCGTDGYLYVGEFYRKGNYETAEEHRITTAAGDENTAIITRFTASSSSSSTTGVSSTSPGRAYSITGLIQGMAITTIDSTTYITLSQSYGLSNSHLLTYKFSTSSVNSSSVAYYNTDRTTPKSLTTYELDSSCLVNDYEIPSMSEGLCTVNRKVYVLFESAGDKYKMFVRERLSNVYSIRMNDSDFSV